MESQHSIVSDIVSKAQKNNEIRKDISVENMARILLGINRLLIKQWYFSSFFLDLEKEHKEL